ncbi:MAG: helix-hairpin-helix domain-containing protein [Blastochloris sp.]|nr:helix-hairpin-helix domain-containing protein [Blastochloris sp.]
MIENLLSTTLWRTRGYDGNQIPADGALDQNILPAINSTGNWFTSGLSASGALSASDVSPSRLLDRPAFLNRPFRSVGELGLVCSNQAWKHIDFRHAQSPYTGLLDLFTLSDLPQIASEPGQITSGVVNLNSLNLETLSARLSGLARNPLNSSERLNDNDARSLADDIIKAVQNHGPLRNRSDLILVLDREFGTSNNANFPARKLEREAALRALISSSTTRSWNLMIDLVAQTGIMQSNETFTVNGERRYWLFVSLDRFTGKVIESKLEPVLE